MKWLSFYCLLVVSPSLEANIYKYQDSEGRWHFTDKSAASEKIEKVEYKSSKPKEEKFRLFSQTETDQQWLMAENKFYAPVQLSVKVNNTAQDWLVEARSTKKIRNLETGKHKFNYAWYLGDPNATPSAQEYSFPIDISACPKITQSFNGSFSHQNTQNKFAVDIGANVGTAILAARDGVVIAMKDDYALGGLDDFFMDKANFVQVLHEDGTWALYAHILLGSAAVQVGDTVKTGDQLAKSGSSGYSSGPHLHFVIQKNAGLKSESIPFQFKAPGGNLFTPKFAQKLCEI
jgi:murein DD-endopeptidase MepM/ murein hydrolase activator NlpD